MFYCIFSNLLPLNPLFNKTILDNFFEIFLLMLLKIVIVLHVFLTRYLDYEETQFPCSLSIFKY